MSVRDAMIPVSPIGPEQVVAGTLAHRPHGLFYTSTPGTSSGMMRAVSLAGLIYGAALCTRWLNILSLLYIAGPAGLGSLSHWAESTEGLLALALFFGHPIAGALLIAGCLGALGRRAVGWTLILAAAGILLLIAAADLAWELYTGITMLPGRSQAIQSVRQGFKFVADFFLARGAAPLLLAALAWGQRWQNRRKAEGCVRLRTND